MKKIKKASEKFANSVQAYNVFACTCGPGCQYCRSGDQYHYFYAGGDNYGKANGSKIQ